jgi:hypothetical protein
LIYLLVYSFHGDWAGGWSWGPRFLLAALPFLVIPSALVFESKRGTLVAAVLALLGIGIQILGVTVNVSYVTWD